MTEYQRTTTRETSGRSPPARRRPADARVRTTDSAYVAPGPGGATLAGRIVTFAFGILQVLLILRIILLLLVANPGNDIVSFVFNITQPFVEPFADMFSLEPGDGGPGLGPGRHRDRRADRLDPRSRHSSSPAIRIFSRRSDRDRLIRHLRHAGVPPRRVRVLLCAERVRRDRRVREAVHSGRCAAASGPLGDRRRMRSTSSAVLGVGPGSA